MWAHKIEIRHFEPTSSEDMESNHEKECKGREVVAAAAANPLLVLLSLRR